MKERDIVYIENEVLKIIQLYIESYLIQKEKGFKNLHDRQLNKEDLKRNINDVISDVSEELNTNMEEIIEILMRCISDYKKNSEKMKCFNEEYSLLENILQELPGNLIKKENEK